MEILQEFSINNNKRYELNILMSWTTWTVVGHFTGIIELLVKIWPQIKQMDRFVHKYWILKTQWPNTSGIDRAVKWSTWVKQPSKTSELYERTGSYLSVFGVAAAVVSTVDERQQTVGDSRASKRYRSTEVHGYW